MMNRFVAAGKSVAAFTASEHAGRKAGGSPKGLTPQLRCSLPALLIEQATEFSQFGFEPRALAFGD